MTIKKEISLQEFDFWAGAKDFAAKLESWEMNQIESILDWDGEAVETLYSETEINDLFWHDKETIAEWLGTTVDSIMARP